MPKKVLISVIIPTRNRAVTLQAALSSLSLACVGVAVECIVVDNGSTDETRQIVSIHAPKAGFPVRYVYEPCPGLHVGRNLGAQLAQADILAFLDDDVIVQAGWAAAIVKRMADPSVALLGGPCRPLWEGGEPPEWIEQFRTRRGEGWILGALSLIDLGTDPQPCSGWMVFGCNFIIRKDVLMRFGGFHPDGLPDELLRYRGDGESYIGAAVDAEEGLTALYDPAVSIMHRVPTERLSGKYFLRIAKRNGISKSYSLFRKFNHCDRKLLKKNMLWLILDAGRKYYRSLRRWIKEPIRDSPVTAADYDMVYKLNILLHLVGIMCNRNMRRWVVQNSYFKEDPCSYRTHEK